MNAADEGRIPSPILDEAAEWLVRLQDSGCTDDTRQACAQWRQRSPQHAHAWERAERLLQCLGRLPPALALPTLGRERGLDRRRAIKHLALVLGGASLGSPPGRPNRCATGWPTSAPASANSAA